MKNFNLGFDSFVNFLQMVLTSNNFGVAYTLLLIKLVAFTLIFLDKNEIFFREREGDLVLLVDRTVLFYVIGMGW